MSVISFQTIPNISGMDKTIQRGDVGRYGALFKIVPMHLGMSPSDNDHISCWYKPVPRWMSHAGQSVIPTDLSEFKVSIKMDLQTIFNFPSK